MKNLLLSAPEPSPIAPDKRGLSERLILLLEQRIRSGQYAPGEKIPTEKQIVETFGVSRSVVREALASLKAEGLLQSKQGIGVFVSSPLPARPFSIQREEILQANSILQAQELRKSVEVEAAGLAALRWNDAQLEAIDRACDKLEQASRHRQGDSSLEDFGVHMAIARATNNAYFPQFLSYLGDLIMLSLNLKYRYSFMDADSDYRREALREHREVVEAIRQRDADKARSLMRAHLSHTQAHYRSLKPPAGPQSA